MKLTKTEIYDIIKQVAKLLYDNDLTCDVMLYADSHKFSFSPDKNYHLLENMPEEYPVYISDDEIDIASCLEYSNPDTFSMTYEGALYYEMNNNFGGRIYTELDNIFNQYSHYLEMGYAWSLSIYPC